MNLGKQIRNITKNELLKYCSTPWLFCFEEDFHTVRIGTYDSNRFMIINTISRVTDSSLMRQFIKE